MKCSLGISNVLEEISSLSHSVVFLYFFALITEEAFLISPCYSLELCIQMLIIFPFLLCFSLLFTAICKASPDSHFAFFISQFSPLSPLQLSWLHSQASDCHIRGMWPQKLPSCIIFTVSCLRGKRDFSLYLQQILSRFCLKSWLTCLGFGLYLNQFRRMGALRLVRPTMWLLFRGLGKEETPLWASRMMGKCPGKRVCGS